VSKTTLVAAFSAALLLGGCSYSTESSFLGYRSSASFATPGAAPAPGYYQAPPAPAPDPAYSEAPPPPDYYPAYPYPAYPAYAPAPVYYGPTIGIGFGRWWGRGRRWR